MYKKYILVGIASLLLSGCALHSDSTEVVGNKRYTPSYPVSSEMKANNSGELYGEFSRYRSEELGITFEYISDVSVFSTGDSETHITRSGSMLYWTDQFGSKLIMIIFTGKNIGSNMNTMEKYFHLDTYSACRMSSRQGISKKEYMGYYLLSFSGTEFPEDGTTFCPYQQTAFSVPIIITNDKLPDTIAMAFGCEACGPEPDISWLSTVEILQGSYE